MASTPSSRSFLSHPFSRRRDGESVETHYPKGPIGLTTLSEPLDVAVADVIFIHGLGGGSRSTWTKAGDMPVFWPEDWLPADAAFVDLRIHSFGYNSNWEKESILNVHDFSRALLGALLDCPTIPRDSAVGIAYILICKNQTRYGKCC